MFLGFWVFKSFACFNAFLVMKHNLFIKKLDIELRIIVSSQIIVIVIKSVSSENHVLPFLSGFQLIHDIKV